MDHSKLGLDDLEGLKVLRDRIAAAEIPSSALDQSINVVTAPEAHILEAVERNYARSASINETIEQVMDGDALELEAEDGSPMVRLADQILGTGVKLRATDIHLHPEEKNMRVRMRVDGILREEVIVPKAIQGALLARVKLMAGVDITERRVPQDGRIRFHFGSSYVDMRVSTLPTQYGESIVVRILDGGATQLSLEHLGFSDNDRARLETAINNPYGMVLVTGSTGSGKTTTLYTALGSIDRESRSVFTLEDPVEYTLPLIRQTQVNADIGMDFATGLRALLRQDPDVILVGEIRDRETAELAIRAALTGHLVFSTIHTNNAVGVIPRLVDMGIERYLLPSALVAVVGQRLLRRLCESCKREQSGPDPLMSSPDLAAMTDRATSHFEASGCDECGDTGYRGRIAVYEVLHVDESFHAAILGGAPEPELLALARDGGLRTMLEDGLAKATAGLTDVKEVLRVLR